ncbi:MAG: hypothetical protein COT71_00600 [Candidatus Andersenbacteria bacterium CG10_big_fil_rev_8_21_14_0_10_54_11]|uniref:Uncharacterized protein n=1 Tax=Candidatus Andersenbacteria bacterium CG10_big_fil_rev_8_21_14_0_10_54_11 TaxID=1974485 RepID=A0A2M6X0B9_9BACT|nr:MAG: hypothetical protein COT71_00600 [Candidatus Andersenbacteria bacterium CG10_big_fil_rev_8_21_14_0_10_54_11]
MIARFLVGARRGLRWVKQGIAAGGFFFPASHYALLALLFGVGLELMFVLQRWVIGVAIALGAVVFLGIFLLVSKERGSFPIFTAVLPVFYVVGTIGFAFLFPTTGLLQVYIVAAALFFFFLLKHAARAVYPVWNWLLTMTTLLLCCAFILGLRFHLDVSVVATLLFVYTAAFLLALQAYRRFYVPAAAGLVPAGTTALVLTELAWLMQFLPIHYLAQASIITVCYYVIFHLLHLYERSGLTRRTLWEYIGVGGAALGIIIISARWI